MTQIRPWLLVTLIASLALGGCEEEAAPPPPVSAPASQARPAQPLTKPSDLAVVLPRLKRDGTFRWRGKSTRVPGHFAAYLHSTEPERKVFIITVDDLRDRPDRLQFYRSMTTTVGRYKGRSVRPDYIQALVGDRYEVTLRATHEEFRSHAKQAHWWDKLGLKKLAELPAEPR